MYFRLASFLVLFMMGIGSYGYAQTDTTSYNWPTDWQKIQLPSGWRYDTYTKPQMQDILHVGEGRLLGKITFSNGAGWKIIYYVYRTENDKESMDLVTKHQSDKADHRCRIDNNMAAGKDTASWAAHAQAYTLYLQIKQNTYLLDNCHSTPCPYNTESWAIIRSIMEYMFSFK